VPAPSVPRTGFAYLDEVLDLPGPIPMAHRGGAKVPELRGLENTMVAFRHAAGLGYRYFETDVHASSDGELFLMHDERLDRVCDRVGHIAELSAADIESVRIGGREPIPRLTDLLEEFPEARVNIDIKAPGAVQPLVAVLDRMNAHQRVCVGAFDRERIVEFRAATAGKVATSAAKSETIRFLLSGHTAGRELLARAGVSVLQLPRVRGPIPVVRPWLVRRAHAAGVHIHVWTVDRARQMGVMIDAGVDGIFTDRTDVLKDVLSARGLWEGRTNGTGRDRRER